MQTNGNNAQMNGNNTQNNEGFFQLFFTERTWKGKTVCVLTVLVALLCMFLAIRYKNVMMGIGAVVFVVAAMLIAIVIIANRKKGISGEYGVPTVAALIAAVVLGIGIFGVLPGIKNSLYTASLGITGEQLLTEFGRQGTKYVVYDDTEKVFVTGILPAERQAAKAGEIGGAFILYTSEVQTGSYQNGDEAYEYRVNVVFRDLYTGETLGSRTLYGGDAPERVSTGSLQFWREKHYGSKPSNDSIRSACMGLLNEYGK